MQLTLACFVGQYLTKQVDLLRQMNDQHARVYEQLDMASKDLEQGNQRLVQDNRLAQHKIQRSANLTIIRTVKYQFQCLNLVLLFFFFEISSLTETIEGLQTYTEDLQAQVEELQSTQLERNKRELAEQRRSIGSQSVSCLKELYNVHQSRCVCMCVCGWHYESGRAPVFCLDSPLASLHDCSALRLLPLKVRAPLIDIIHKRKLILLLSAVFFQI